MASFKVKDRVYELQTKLGSGAQGDTFLYRSNDNFYTVKITNILAGLQENVPSQVRRRYDNFMKEARVLAQLKDTCQEFGFPCLVYYEVLSEKHPMFSLFHPNPKANGMLGLSIYDFVPGIPFSDVVGKSFNFETLKTLMLETSKALMEMHVRGIAHRDIKPGNIIYNPDLTENNFTLIDFGMSCLMDSCTGMVGTPNFVQPKVLEGTYRQTTLQDYQQQDVYGLGAVYYYYINQQHPMKIHRQGARYVVLGYREFVTPVPDDIKTLVELMLTNPEMGAKYFYQQIVKVFNNY